MTTQKEMEEIRTALSWFDVRRYDGLKDLTLEQIYAELERRMLAYKQGNNGKQQAKIIKCKLYTMMPKSDVVM